jgi:protein ImuA
MPPATERHLVLARLREEIRRIERSPARREGVAPSGLADVDAVLPGGGFPRGALSALSGGPARGKTAVALALLAALGPEDLAAYVDGRGELYPPAAAARGVDLARLLVVRPPAARGGAGGRGGVTPGVRAGLWAAEALLASGAFAAVAIDLPIPRALPGADAAARRLQAAAERGGAVGLWLAPGKGLRIPAALRIEIALEGGRISARRVVGGAPTPRGGGTRAA